MTRFAVVGLCLALCACRTSESPGKSSDPPGNAAGSPGAPPAAPARVPDTRPAIVAFGDSLTAGFGVDPGQSYPDFLQRELDQRGYGYRVVNEGVSGDTTSDGLARVAMVVAQKPEIVILALGGNDGLRGLPVATTRQNLEKLIVTLRDGGARVVLAGITLPPNYGPDYIRDFEAVYRDLAARYRLPFIPFLLSGVAGSGGYMQRDGLHANVEGNRRVAATVLKSIQPLLRTPSTPLKK